MSPRRSRVAGRVPMRAGCGSRCAPRRRRDLRSHPVKIVVCVKHVPGGRLRIDPGTKCLDRSGPGELNAVDKNAVGGALGLKEGTGAEVVLVSMDPEAAVESLRTGLAMGADRAVLVSDPAARGSDLVATSRVLAKAVEREQADLV